MKKFIIFFLVVIVSFANPKVKNADLKFPKNFLKSFDIYKNARMEKDAKKLYEIQVPFFKYLNSFSHYKDYVGWLVKTESIKIDKIVEKNDDFVEILLKLKLKNKENMLYYNQSWYRIGNRYYMLTKEDLLFKY